MEAKWSSRRASFAARCPARRVDAGAGVVNGIPINVCGEDVDLELCLERIHAFAEENGQGAGFFAGGASGNPDGNGLLLNLNKDVGVAEEAGDADEEGTKQGVDFGWSEFEEAKVVFEASDRVDGHAPFDAAADGIALVLGKVVTVV